MIKNHRSITKYLFILVVIILLAGTQACTPEEPGFEQPPPGEEPPPEEFFEGEPPPEGEEPPPGEVWIEFNVERPHLMPGECTMLFWHTEGAFEVFFNGEPVEPSGEREECLGESRMFILEVETGQGMQMREIEVMVEGEPMEGHPPEEPPMEEHPPEEPPMEEPPMEEPPPESGQSQSQQSQPQQPQPQQSQSQSSGSSSSTNKCQSNFETDIAVTDIYAGNLPHGQVHIRITNHGPCTLHNVKDSVYCFLDKTNHSTNKVSYDAKAVNVVYNIAPGKQQTFPTGISLDTGVFNYKVTCNLQPGNFKELNPGNNSYSENIP